MNRFDILLWDVDQTLLDFEKSQEYALRSSFGRFGRSIREEEIALYRGINEGYWKRHERGEVSKEELLKGRFADLFDKLNISDISVSDFAALYQEVLGTVYYFRDDALELCTGLRGKVRQYALTNGVTATQRNKLHRSGLDKVLDGIFISEEIGEPKPSVGFFEKCFQRIPGFERERTLIVGDSLTSDMQGGNNAGICCCWYNPDGMKNNTDLRIDFEIRNLWEIKEIL